VKKSPDKVLVPKRRYTGMLATPIRIPTLPTFSGAVTRSRVRKFWKDYKQHQKKVEALERDQKEEKIRLLHQHYGIPGRDMEALALALAAAHVAGFKVLDGNRRKRGRKKEWDGPKLEALYQDVQAVKAAERCNVRQALKFIAKDPSYGGKWAPPNGPRHNFNKWVETLESRLNDAKHYVQFTESLPDRLEVIRNRIIK